MSSKSGHLFFGLLQNKALECLDTFPSKVVELNEIIEKYMPESAISNNHNFNNVIRPSARSASTLSSNKDFTPYYSLSTCYRNRVKHGINKRRYRRIYGDNSRTTIRQYPGALGQLLAFVVSRLASCTKKIVLLPSYFVIDNVVPMLFKKSGFQSVQHGPSSDWSSSLLEYPTDNKNDNTIVSNLIDVMRPAAVQLIADITILKRWLQAFTLIKTSVKSIELTNATRTAETIDSWAYELYFHLKNLQVKIQQEKVNDEKESKDRNDVRHLNLWHRMVQLRNNYIILYETLNDNRKILNVSSMEVSR